LKRQDPLLEFGNGLPLFAVAFHEAHFILGLCK
jgi:hypothetical protein